MADSNPSAHPPLEADDPRISEWLDGRLAPSEAAAIERAVAASPELTLLVEDLRTIRKAMRAGSGDAPPVDFGDRIMAAIASSSRSAPAMAVASRRTSSAPSRGRRLPWLGLLGALAAGVLVTVVINLPNEDGREVALAPESDRGHQVGGRGEPLRETTKDVVGRQVDRLEEGESHDAIAEDDSVGRAGGTPVVQERLRDRELNARESAEVASNAVAAVNASPPPGVPQPLESFAYTANDESVPMFAGGGGAANPQVAAAPASAATPPAVPGDAAPLEKAKEGFLEEQEPAVLAAKRAKMDLAGVLVIAVTNASERRALDRLVAESRLQATPEKDHIALAGTAADIDAFLQELTRVGLVSAVPARRAAEAGKVTVDSRSGARNTTLIVRVVERKGKQPAPVQAGEAETKP